MAISLRCRRCAPNVFHSASLARVLTPPLALTPGLLVILVADADSQGLLASLQGHSHALKPARAIPVKNHSLPPFGAVAGGSGSGIQCVGSTLGY